MKQPVVIFEDNHLLGINKPAGWLVQGDRTGDETLIDWCKAYLKEKYAKPGEVFVGCIHRIDRPVSGVVIFAKTSKALERMNALLAKSQIQKTYLAVTDQEIQPENGHLEHILAKDEAKNRAYVVRDASKGKLCKLDYKVLSISREGYTLVEVRPLTGRPHQIRVQLATMHWPIVGDLKYGSTRFVTDQSIGLHCHAMAFVHPVTQEYCTITAEPWADSDAFRKVER